MRWHQVLRELEDPTLHQQVVRKTLLPLLHRHVPLLNLQHARATPLVLRMLQELLDYLERGSAEFQELLALLERQLRASIASTYSAKAPTFQAQVSVIVSMHAWIGYFPQTCRAFLWDLGIPAALKHLRSLDASAMLHVSGDRGLDEVMSLLEELERLATAIPKEFPRDLLAGAITPFLCTPHAPQPFYQRGIRVAVQLECFAIATQISSYLR
jgi:hypothetical protein